MIGVLKGSAWAHICKAFKEPGSRFPVCVPVRQPYLSYGLAKLYKGWRNRFLGSLNVYKHGLRKGWLGPGSENIFGLENSSQIWAEFSIEVTEKAGWDRKWRYVWFGKFFCIMSGVLNGSDWNAGWDLKLEFRSLNLAGQGELSWLRSYRPAWAKQPLRAVMTLHCKKF